jgi:hypothetical protein
MSALCDYLCQYSNDVLGSKFIIRLYKSSEKDMVAVSCFTIFCLLIELSYCHDLAVVFCTCKG